MYTYSNSDSVHIRKGSSMELHFSERRRTTAVKIVGSYLRQLNRENAAISLSELVIAGMNWCG